jgi:hypothetical protein
VITLDVAGPDGVVGVEGLLPLEPLEPPQLTHSRVASNARNMV